MKFQKLTRGGMEYRIYAENCGGLYPIHGALKTGLQTWNPVTWTKDGEVTTKHTCDGDLLPEKKRRFKTNEELIASEYSDISFNCYGVIDVRHMGLMLTRTRSDTSEGSYSEKWLEVFTVEENI